MGAIRRRIVEDVARSGLPGLILTYVWAFDDPRDRRQPEEFAAIFAGHGREAYFVELEASLEERLSRNTSALRLSHKPSAAVLIRDRFALPRVAPSPAA